MEHDDVFCQIVAKKTPSDILFEDQTLMVIKNLYPKTPVHYLVIPKKHIESLNKMEEEDIEILGKMMLSAQKAAKMLGIEKGYKTSFNVEKGGGQEIFHLHLHLVGGWDKDNGA